MTNNRQKGKRLERKAVNDLKDIFPQVSRNWNGQTVDGGVDLLNTPSFDFEIKGGKQAKIKKIRKWLDQVKKEGSEENWDCVLAYPDYEEPYVIMPFSDFLEILGTLKFEDII